MQNGREASPSEATTMCVTTDARNNQLTPSRYQHAESVRIPQRLQGWHRQPWGMGACGAAVPEFLGSQPTSSQWEAQPSPRAEGCSAGWWSWHWDTSLHSFPPSSPAQPLPLSSIQKVWVQHAALAPIHSVSSALLSQYQQLPEEKGEPAPNPAYLLPWRWGGRAVGVPHPQCQGERGRGAEG